MMTPARLFFSTFLLGGSAIVAAAQELPSVYELDLSRGSFPAGVETANLNGVLPDKDAYKHGYVTTGWTVDRLDTRGYVALSPTYSGEARACENLLSLPAFSIESKNALEWEARSVYRHFPESYKVVAYPEDGSEPILLAEVEEEDYQWRQRAVELDKCAGKDVKIGFVCTSNSGYMLALTGIRVVPELLPPPMPTAAEMESNEAEESSGFLRTLVVDKGTGMWCVNCPEGELVIESLENIYGSRMIVLNTHVNDILANDDYWAELKYYSVPRMMLNRIRATEGSNAKKFANYYDLPTSFGISIAAPVGISERTLKVKADVKVSENIDNSDGRYSVGYVLTGNFHEPDNPRYAQKNNCSLPANGAYYFLPSTIPSPLMYYENVTLTSQTAFSGIEGSLPASMVPGEDYEVSWECDVPEVLADVKAARIVAFVIDTTTGELMNAAALQADAESAIHEVVATPAVSLFSIEPGCVHTALLAGESFSFEVFTSAGVLLSSKSGKAVGNDIFQLPETDGIMIIRLCSSNGTQTAKVRR